MSSVSEVELLQAYRLILGREPEKDLDLSESTKH